MEEKFVEEKIILEAEDGTQEAFYIVEATKLNGVEYLLVADSEEDDAECLILKDISLPEEEDALFVPVEDDTELNSVMKIFEELLDDITIEE